MDRAERDVVFLFKLQFHLNARVHEEGLPQTLCHALLLDKSQLLARDLDDYKATKRKSRALARRIKDQAEALRMVATPFLGRLYVLDKCVDTLSRRYFDGHDPLFPESREGLKGMQKSWSCVLELYNDYLAPGLGRGQRLDVGALEQDWKENAAKDTAFLVDLAKAETLRLMGEVNAASDLMMPYV